MRYSVPDLFNAKDAEEAELIMRYLKRHFTGQEIINMARDANWLVSKNTDLAEYLMSPGYASLDDGNRVEYK